MVVQGALGGYPGVAERNRALISVAFVVVSSAGLCPTTTRCARAFVSSIDPADRLTNESISVLVCAGVRVFVETFVVPASPINRIFLHAVHDDDRSVDFF